MSTPSGRMTEEEKKRREGRRAREEKKKLEEEEEEEKKERKKERRRETEETRKEDQEALAKLADQKPADPTLPNDDSDKEVKTAREIPKRMLRKRKAVI